jgi:hypothetical protein
MERRLDAKANKMQRFSVNRCLWEPGVFIKIMAGSLVTLGVLAELPGAFLPALGQFSSHQQPSDLQ